MNLKADALAVIFLGTAIALYYLGMKTAGGMMVKKGGDAEKIGNAILTIFP